MNSANILTAKTGMNSGLSGALSTKGVRVGVYENKSSREADKKNALDAVASLKATSDSLLKQSANGALTVTQAVLDAIRALWQFIINIVRFLARAVGMPRPATNASDEAGIASTKRSAVDTGADTEASKPGMASASDVAQTQSLVAKSAAEMMDTIDTVDTEQTPATDAFMDAIAFSGLGEADAALIRFANDPESFKTSTGPEQVLMAAFKTAALAVESLQEKLLHAQAERAKAAEALVDKFSHPLLTEDLVNIYRGNTKLAAASGEDQSKIEQLLAADDSLQLVAGHQKLIVETLAGVAHSAQASGVELDTHHALLARVLGADWKSVVLAAPETQAQAAAQARAAQQATAAIAAMKAVAPDFSTAKKDAEAFLGGAAPTKKLSARERLRMASAEVGNQPDNIFLNMDSQDGNPDDAHQSRPAE